MKVEALDEIEGKLRDVDTCVVAASDGAQPIPNLIAAIDLIVDCLLILNDRLKAERRSDGTLRRIAERLETMEG
jgi:hypothetical protein